MLRITKPNYKECYVNDELINSNIIIDNKLFHDDILNDDYSLKSSNRQDIMLGGVLKIKNIYTFGTNKKNVELFEFQPINWRYPKFLVASTIKKTLLKNKEKVVDYFVVVKFKEWISKIPSGFIHISLGPVTNINNKYEVILYYYPYKPIIQIKNDEKKNVIETIKNDEKKNVIDKNVYTIDPENCKDMDDAISYDNGRVGIHIIDVDYYNPDISKCNLYSSIYAPHKTIHMLPTELSTDKLSLKEGEERRVITCWINKDLKCTFENNIIKVTKNLSYDKVEEYLVSNVNVFNELFKKSKEIGKLIGIDIEENDSHKMIEIFMVFYNKNIICNLETKKIIYRNQECLTSKAYYSYENIGHYSLNLTYYTHATSPIRRYIDIMIQKIFNKKVDEIDLDLNKVNNFNNDMKCLYRIWDNLKMSINIKNGDFYDIIFKEINDYGIVFWCENLNSFIYNKIEYNLIDDDKCVINNKTYNIGEKYNKQLFLKDDYKHVLFYKILIQF